jgi:shikimate dehydrogenase
MLFSWYFDLYDRETSAYMPIKIRKPPAPATSWRVGLIGNPVAHSFSPRLQQPAFDTLHFPARYELWHTPEQQLVERVRSLCEKDCLGANVTIPYKESVLALLDRVDPLAARIGAVNTIVHQNDYLYGYNTDARGLLNALAEQGLGQRLSKTNISFKGHTVVLLGAGGAARGAAFSLLEGGIERLIILNRHLERAQRLASELQYHYEQPIFSLNDPAFLMPSASSIIINATSLGMHEDISPLPPEILSRFGPETFVFDMIYNPTQTYLLTQARLMGLRTANGLSMLLHQGALAFTLWTRLPAPIDVMRAALA